MSIPMWIIVGMIAGWLTTRAVPEGGSAGILQHVLVGVIGAVAGGWILQAFGHPGGSSVGAFTGAVMSLWILRVLDRRWARIQA
jgi:uncharacterized membrane protein YeaQ/YmgE (transglycosylase-associated protein family)